MKKFSLLLAATALSFLFAGPASAHCGSCGVGGGDDGKECTAGCDEKKNCECAGGEDCEKACPHAEQGE